MVESKPLVVVTGITGFLGSHTALQFLLDGGFRVRGTVRSLANEDKLKPIKEHFGEHYENLELVEADLLDDESMQNALEGATYVAHTASPFTIVKPNHEDDLIRPAVDGTLSVMKGCQKHGVKRVVITSSVAAVNHRAEPLTHITHNDWSETDWRGEDAYCKSKTLAERSAWDFVEKLPEGEKFELATVNPVLITGPAICKSGFSSEEIINMVYLGKLPLVDMEFMCVDVRDTAKAHVQAIKVEEAAGKRFLLIEGAY